MAKTSSVYTRVEPELKQQAEIVLEQLPQNKPLVYGSLTKEQFDAEINKGIKSIDEGRVFSADDVEAEMLREEQTIE